MRNEVSPHHTRIARDVGLARLRRLTGVAVAAALGLSAVFAGIAAGSTHPRKVVRAVRARSTRRLSSTPALPPAQAPSFGDAAPSASPTPPASSPAPAVSPPVAVSGGS